MLVSTLIRTVRPLERRALTRLPTASLRSTIVCVAPSFYRSAGTTFIQRMSFAHNVMVYHSHEAEWARTPTGFTGENRRLSSSSYSVALSAGANKCVAETGG